jgi:DNA repair exonuclease SbcCD ATPase subunit
MSENSSSLDVALMRQSKALETKRAIKTYVSFSFNEALDAIGDKATKIIRCIPNTKNATIEFEGTKETQKGTVKEEVNAVISVDGELGVPIKSLSGGERSSTDLAVDLAVIDYIESKTGKGLNLFILDEPFTGLGTVEIEMALEVLKNANINKKLFIVDHNAEVKQMVQDRLIVVRDGLTSKVT